jgi:hypothetical protein
MRPVLVILPSAQGLIAADIKIFAGRIKLDHKITANQNQLAAAPLVHQ